MRQFDFYEFTGIIVPGMTLLVAVSLCIPAAGSAAFASSMSIGGASIALVLAYGLGHLVQALGNIVEKVWWHFWRGMPSDWPRTNAHPLLAPQQLNDLALALSRQGISLSGQITTLTRSEWYAHVRHIYVAVRGAGRADRVDVFNGNYGLNRGLAACFLVITVMIALTVDPIPWPYVILTVCAMGVALFRMHRFGVHYAREVFVQLLHMPPRGVADDHIERSRASD